MGRNTIDTSKLKDDDDGKTGVKPGGEQGDLFRELDDGNPEHKKLKQLARNWLAVIDEREEMKHDSKKREDEAHKKLLDQAELVGQKEFVVAGRVIRINLRRKASQAPMKVKKSKKPKKDKADKKQPAAAAA